MGLFSSHKPEPTRDPRPKGTNNLRDPGHVKMFRMGLGKNWRANERAAGRDEPTPSKGWGMKLW